MLTKGAAPDPKGKLKTLLIVRLPHLVDCYTRSRNFLSIILSQMMGGGMGSMSLINIRLYLYLCR